MGYTRIVISVTNIVGVRAGPPNGSGIVPAPAPSFVVNCQAPAGLLVNSHSYPYSISKNVLSHVVGVAVHTTLRPLVMASLPTPVPNELFQPRPCSSSGQPSGSGPTRSPSPAPWVLPTEWPPTISAAVSSSFIAIRPNVSRISFAAAAGSGCPSGPSGFT